MVASSLDDATDGEVVWRCDNEVVEGGGREMARDGGRASRKGGQAGGRGGGPGYDHVGDRGRKVLAEVLGRTAHWPTRHVLSIAPRENT